MIQRQLLHFAEIVAMNAYLSPDKRKFSKRFVVGKSHRPANNEQKRRNFRG